MSDSAIVETPIPTVDSHLLKFSQAGVIILSGVGFLFNQPIIVLLGALCLTISAVRPSISPFRLLYRHVAVPLKLLKPHIVEDDPAPHRFAQGVGAAFLIAASIFLFFTQASIVGWILDIIVLILAITNFTVGFCAGCFVYYHLGKMGITPRVLYQGSFRWRGV